MKYQITLLFILSGIISFAQNIRKINFHSDVLNQDRKVWIYTPAGFEEDEDHYEVIYVFDAQVRFYFDLIHSGIQFLSNERYIVVGDVSPYDEATQYNRNTDFFPKPVHENPETYYDGWNGNAQKHLEYLYKELTPYLEKNYRTLPNRTAVGHSNGGTFILYCLLQQPDLFNNYIAVSPNMAYDQEQMIERFKKFDGNSLKSEKFIYVSHADESQWKGWKEAREKWYDWLKTNPSDQITYEIEDLSDYTHFNSFPFASMSGLKKFTTYWSHDVDRVLSYKKSLKTILGPAYSSSLNTLAYSYFHDDKPDSAIKVIDTAIAECPEDDNLYDSKGEFLEDSKQYDKAGKYYQKALEVLKTNKEKMSASDYDYKIKLYQKNYMRVKDL
ncbi:alpha/beta hydrolase-fold protein [Sinomicrobium weinanense]|uniref:Alpha/beta hydrolase n=1 Tax=Sinomicrobium weinanense TaxID=2842200 RepID=A0A926JQY3_9FLAO|nr:alpha/beta hydrolase-fold protein [Sinomicrobium weinanense]MBC9795663.1 hypothetical protein [Sinomicrobium weinanense]MBU3122832.1 hypothetical protein [Sinomicrobium weinanense]